MGQPDLGAAADALMNFGGLNNWQQMQTQQAQQPSPFAPTTKSVPPTQQQGHRHTHLPLNHLRHSSPVLLSIGAENAPKIVAKLKEFVEEVKAMNGEALLGSVGQAEYHLLDNLQDALVKNKDRLADVNLGADANGIFELMRRLVFALPLDKLFPCLDILRLLVLINSSNQHYATTEGLFSVSSFVFLFLFLSLSLSISFSFFLFLFLSLSRFSFLFCSILIISSLASGYYNWHPYQNCYKEG